LLGHVVSSNAAMRILTPSRLLCTGRAFSRERLERILQA
jgi:hypothetical protein